MSKSKQTLQQNIANLKSDLLSKNEIITTELNEPIYLKN